MSMGSSSHSISTSVLWVAISPAFRSSNSKTFCMNSFSSWSMPPFLLLASTIMRMSASPYCSSSCSGSMPISRSTPFVDTVSSHTTGAKSFEIKPISPDIPSASFSGFFMAMRFGTSSPNTRVKYDSTRVMNMTARVSSVERGMVTPRPTSQFTIPSEKLSAAKALPRKPDSVMATCMVARNFAGCSMSRPSRPARLLPSEASLLSLVSLTDSTAISALANTALSIMSTACSSSMKAIEVSKMFSPLSSLCYSSKTRKKA